MVRESVLEPCLRQFRPATPGGLGGDHGLSGDAVSNDGEGLEEEERRVQAALDEISPEGG